MKFVRQMLTGFHPAEGRHFKS